MYKAFPHARKEKVKVNPITCIAGEKIWQHDDKYALNHLIAPIRRRHARQGESISWYACAEFRKMRRELSKHRELSMVSILPRAASMTSLLINSWGWLLHNSRLCENNTHKPTLSQLKCIQRNRCLILAWVLILGDLASSDALKSREGVCVTKRHHLYS